jgi:phage major head subunit gpT-like protein
MKVKVNTKSNYQNLNGQWLELREIVGTRVTCIVKFAEFGKQTVDFNLKEVTEIDTTSSIETKLDPIFELALKPFC